MSTLPLRYICDGAWIYDRDLPAFKDNQGHYSHVIKVKAGSKVTVNKQLQEENFDSDIDVYKLSIRDTLNNMETCVKARDYILSALTVKQSNSKLIRTPSPSRKNYSRNESSAITQPQTKLPIIKLRESVERDEIVSELIVPYMPDPYDVIVKSRDIARAKDKEEKEIKQLQDEVIITATITNIVEKINTQNSEKCLAIWLNASPEFDNLHTNTDEFFQSYHSWYH